MEHEKRCADHCPNCGAGQHGGYVDIDFGGSVRGATEYAFVRFRCAMCGTEYVERFAYDATWYETDDEDTI